MHLLPTTARHSQSRGPALTPLIFVVGFPSTPSASVPMIVCVRLAYAPMDLAEHLNGILETHRVLAPHKPLPLFGGSVGLAHTPASCVDFQRVEVVVHACAFAHQEERLPLCWRTPRLIPIVRNPLSAQCGLC